MKIGICMIAIVAMAMNVQARQYGFMPKIFKPRTSKVVVRTGNRHVGEIMKSGENMVKTGISAKKIEAAGKAVGYGMVGGATVIAAHSITSESRAKGEGIDDWNKRMEAEFARLPLEERKEIMKVVVEKNFECGWIVLMQYIVVCGSVVAALFGAFVIWRKKWNKKRVD